MQDRCIIGIDLGTSSIKMAALNCKGVLVASHRQPYGPGHQPRAHDAATIWEAFVTGLAAWVHKYKLNPAALCLSTHMHSWALQHPGQGEVKGLFLLWNHELGATSANELKNNHTELAEQIYLNTGTPHHAMSPLHKTRALIRQGLPTGMKLGGVKEWLFARLTGHWVMDVSLAGATGLWNGQAGQWEPAALAWAGVDASHLAPVVPNLYFQPLRAPMGGLPAGLPVCIGSSDGCLAMHYSAWIAPGQASFTMGSSMAARCLLPAPALSWPEQPFCYPLLDEWVQGAPGNNGGSALDWIAGSLLGLEHAHKARFWSLLESSRQRFNDDQLFLPFVNSGERAPLWNSQQTAQWLGSAEQMAPRDKAGLAVESVLLHAALLVNLLPLKAHQQVVLSGGGLQAPVLRQRLANVLGRTCLWSELPADASASGAALLGMQVMNWPVPPPNQTLHSIVPQADQVPYFSHRLALYQHRIHSLTTLDSPS